MTRRAGGVARTRTPLVVTLVGPHPLPVAARGLATWLAGAAPSQAAGSAIVVALVSDRAIRDLNRRFRRVDAATDVLSFPETTPVPGERLKGRKLGEIAIGLGVAARQATAEGHATRMELRLLALHGLLHLLGYDHERDNGEMRRAEERLRRRAGVPAGLITRVPGRPSGR